MLGKLKDKVSKDGNLKELLSGSLITFLLKMSGLFFGYIALYLISTKKGADGVGYYSLINQVLIVASLFAGLGANTAVLRFVGQYNNDKDRTKLKSLHKIVVSLIVPASMLFGIILFLTSDYVATTIFKNSDYQTALQVVALFLPVFVLDRVSIEFLRGFKRLKVSEFIRTVSKPLVIIILMLFFWNSEIPNLYIIYFVCAAVLVNALASNSFVIYLLSRINGVTLKSVSRKQFFEVSSPMMVSGIAGTLMSSISLFVLEFYETTDQVGIYSVVVRISQLISIILVVTNTIAAPKFSELYWAKKRDQLQKLITQSAKMMFWIALAMAVVISIGSSWLLYLFGPEFIAGQTALFILVFSQLFNAATGSVGLFLNMSGNQKTLRNTALIALPIQIILAIILIPKFGMVGSALATGIAGIIWNIMCILYVQKKLNIKTYYFFK